MFKRAVLAIFLGAVLFVSPNALAKGADKDQAGGEKAAREDRVKGDDGDEGDGDGRYDHGRYRYGRGYYYSEPTDPSHFHARMTGDQEVPKEGAPGGRGLARLDVDPYEHRVCYELSYEGIGKPTGAHIHRGRFEENGRVVVDLEFDRNGDRGCVPGNPRVLRDMQAQPQAYYVNLHTAEFPDGAIRGQVDYPTR